MTTSSDLRGGKESPGWRTELQYALAQPELAALNPEDAGAQRAAYHLAVVIGHCRLEEVRLGDLDGSLQPLAALAAGRKLSSLLVRRSEDVRNLEDRLRAAESETEADDLCFGVLEARMEVWAAFVALDEAYQVCVEDRAEERGALSTLLAQLLDEIDRLDWLMQERLDLLTRVATFPLLANWKRALGLTYSEVLPWWLDGRIQRRAADLADDPLTWLPRSGLAVHGHRTNGRQRQQTKAASPMPTAAGAEFEQVEWPLIQDLEKLGWEALEGDVHVPGLTDNRASFRDVLLKDRLARALVRINLDDAGQPWMDESRVREAMSALERLYATRLMEANEAAFRLLLQGVSVSGDPRIAGGRDRMVRFIDFSHVADPSLPDRNEYLLVRQFRVDGRQSIIPDLVLFVNGIPLVVIECKSPKINDPLGAGVDQLLRCSNQRDWIDEDEGAESLFYFNQLLVSTSGERALVGTVGSAAEHFAEWKDVAPMTVEAVKAELGVVGSLTGQQVMAAGLLRPSRLLDVVRNFILFKRDQGKVIKIAARYPQYRAVHAALRRLRTGQTREQSGDRDMRGGVIWHTQGSGKSFTMTFLVRAMRTSRDLRHFKVVVVTDRTDLEEQLSASAALSGETPRIPTSADRLEKTLGEEGPDLVFAMIQKYRRDEEDEEEAVEVKLKTVNPSPAILVLVDEAHRSHTKDWHANLRQALQNCAMIGFTGTPIVEEDKKTTEEIFGPFLDRYRLKESEEDGATLPIMYEGWNAKGVVIDGNNIDGLFDSYFADRTAKDREAIKGKYANRFKILEAIGLIEMKARHMFRHYVEQVLPRGLKAQVVAVSRRAAVRFQEKLDQARKELVTQLEAMKPALLALAEAGGDLTDEQQFLVKAYPHLGTLKSLEFAAVISPKLTGDDSDPPSWRQWTDDGKVRENLVAFKKPLFAESPENRSPLAVLCVKSMLLTGFDAPVEQVLYLDRPMKGAELLQAIARVNRTYPGKGCGLVVDYCGVAQHLADALAMYANEDREQVMRRLSDLLPTLEDTHRAVMNVFREQGLDIYADRAACVDVLADIRLRAEFTVKLRLFLEALDMLLPRSEGLAFTRDARQLGLINMQAKLRYRDEQLNVRGAGPRVEMLIDQAVRATGIDPKVPPVSILSVNFAEVVRAAGSSRARASEMEHAARHHISVHLAEDPAHYQKLSEHLEQILQDFRDNWDDLARELETFVGHVQRAESREVAGLDRDREAPFYRSLADALEETSDPQSPNPALVQGCREMVEHLRQQVRAVDFWRNDTMIRRLRGWLVSFLDDHDVPPEKQEALADQLMQQAKRLHVKLVA